MSSTDELSGVMKELDDLIMRILYLMKEYIDVKLTLDELMKSGSLHLAKSRYIMGNRSVSALQLPAEDSNEFTASAKVNPVKSNSDQLIYELSRLSINDCDKGMRSRHSKNVDSKETVDDKGRIAENFRDPLKWFGVLVPQNMRQAQKSFSKALDYVIEGTNIQLEIDRLKVLYSLKLKQKHELLKLQREHPVENGSVMDAT